MLKRLAISAGASIALFNCAQADDRIIVTAERRASDVNEAAASIAVIAGDELVAQNPDHISEALARVPGVSLHRGSGAEHLTAIRSPILTGGAGAGSFLYLENGVPIRSAGFANVNGLFDAHYEIAGGIEVVRGPSGALYGANAIHGVINVLTPDPREADAVFVDVFGDTEDRYKWKGALAHVAGQHAFLAAASAVSESGYRDDAGLDQQKLTLRHTFDRDAVEIDTIFSFHNLEQETAGFIFGEAALRDRRLRRSNDFPFAYRDAKAARLQSTISVALTDDAEVRVTPYVRWNAMEFPQHFLPSNALERNDHWSVGVQSGYYRALGRAEFIAGVDAEYTEGSLFEFQSDPTIFSFTQGLHYDYAVRAINASGFISLDYPITDRLTFNAATRLDGAVYNYDNRASDGVVGRFLRPADRVDRFVTASPKASLRYEFSDRANAYLRFARGARPPQTTDLYRLQINQTGAEARPELIDNIEAGLRLNPANGVNITLAGYFMNKRNFFFRDADGFNVADGKTRHAGVEADIQIALTSRLSLASAITYARHTYRFDRPVGSASESITFGDFVDSAPRVLANTRLDWRPDDRLTLGAEWVSVGGYFTDAANDNFYGGHNLLHLRGEMKLTGSLAGYLALRNVTDALYAERADFAFGEDRFFPGEVRTLGFGLRLRR